MVASRGGSHRLQVGYPQETSTDSRASATSTGAGASCKVRASQNDDCALGAGVGPLVESSVHGGAAVLGDEDQLDAAQLRQVGPGLGPCSRRCRHGDDGTGSQIIMVKV